MKVLCTLLIFLLCAVCNISATRTVIAHGIKPHLYQLLGKSNASSIINFKVLLKQNNTDVIDKTFWEVSNPKHPRYGKFLTRSEVDSLVASPPESVQAVKYWLDQEGVTSSQLTMFSDYISVKVPVSHAEQIFQSSFFDFQSKKGKKITRINGTASIPEEIIPHIDFISGLSEFLADAHHTPVPFSPSIVKRDDTTITPQVLFDLYNYGANTPNSANTQGIAAFDDYYSSGALQNFWSNFDIPSTQIIISGTDCLSGGCDQAESDIDIQYMTAIGQGIPTYFITIDQDGWILDWAQQIEALENPPLVNSISYGIEEIVECDNNFECPTLGFNPQTYIARADIELAKLGALGITVMVSSGDNGAPGYASGNCPIDDSKYCPLGGCKHQSTNCGALTFMDTSTNETCFYPTGINSSSCVSFMAQLTFNLALLYWETTPTLCDLEIDQDSYGNYHVYSSCTCDQIPESTVLNFQFSGYTFDQNAGAIFSVSYPATSPYVTAVGATMLLSGNTEIAASIENGAIITSGGGFSLNTPMPDYQQSAVLSYLNSGTPLPPSFSFNPQNRAIPDIALNGHNYQVSISTNSKNYDKCPCEIDSVDGTSCSTPAFAGFISLINNLLLNEGLGPVGPLNQILYQMAIDEPSAFNTISESDNKCTGSYCCLYGYETGDNVWNPVTGLGTPDFTQLQNYILQSKRTDPILPGLEIPISSAVWEDSSLTLTCPLTYYIGSIDSASFGFLLGSCTSPNSIPIVQQACLYQQTCTILASDSVFGDPCPGFTKGLLVSATCVSVPTHFCDTENEGGSINLKCADGYSIQEINFASYGIPLSTLCGAEKIGDCHASNSLSVVQGLCLNQQNCSVQASNSQFYDPCVGYYKSLTIRATCAPLITVCETVQENDTLVLQPPYPNYAIEAIDFASYGQYDLTTCESEITGCYSPNSLSVVSSNCLYQPSCSLEATTDFFGGDDPCPETSNALTVRVGYSGVPLTLCETVPENSFVNLQCAPGYVIDEIAFASFGVPFSTTCGQEQVGSCNSPNSLITVLNNCAGLNSCNLQATNTIFGGDPCSGTVKELTVRVNCLLEGQQCTPNIPENEWIELNCGNDNLVISTINFVSYGVPSSAQCGAEQIGSCHAQNSWDVIAQACLGKPSCTVQASDTFFGGDPCPGTTIPKSLSVRWTC